jgi:hypothetical protein
MLRIRVQSMEEAIRKIKENPLSYSTEDYKKIMEGNLELLKDSKQKFTLHREHIEEKINEFIEKDIHIKELNEEEKESLNNLKTIENYLDRTIDEDQRILIKHFDLKSIYGRELENISKMALIERFNFKSEVYNRILENPEKLENIEEFLRPLFRMESRKIYNINKAVEFQKNIKEKTVEKDELISFDEGDLLEEQNKRKLERLEKYKGVIEIILELTRERGSISFGEINSLIKESQVLMNSLIPSIEIFREVIIEMLKNRIIYIEEIKEERNNAVESGEIEFQLNKSILEIIDTNKKLKRISIIEIEKIIGNDDVKLEGLKDDNGVIKNFICSDISFRVIEGGFKL